MAQNYAAKYSGKVDERFKLASLTNAAVNKDYDWSGVQTVNVYQVDNAPMNDYARSGSNRYGAIEELGTQLQELTLTRDRSFTRSIDRGNYTEEMMVTEAGKFLRRQIDEVVIPEVDIYRLATMAAAAVNNGAIPGTPAPITATNAYSAFLEATETLSDAKVPLTRRIAFITPQYYSFLKLDSNFIKSSEIGQKMLINGQVGEVDGVRVVVAPSSYFPANTEMVMTHPSATVAPDKLTDYKTHNNPPGINGWLVEGRLIYDAFVLDAKVDALFAWTTS